MASLTHKVNTYSDGSFDGTITPIPPRTEKLCVVLHGFQIANPNNYKNDPEHYYPNTLTPARPCATRMKDFRPTIMTWALQNLHFRILKETAGDIMSEAELKQAFRSLWEDGREYNDHGASDGTNFIAKPSGDPPGFKMNPIVGDGMIFKIVDGGFPTTIGVVEGRTFGLGEPCWPVEFMNAKNMDYSSNPQKHPYWWHRANIARRDGTIIRYGQLSKRMEDGHVEERDVWMPNLRPDSNINWVPTRVVRVLSQTEPLPNPYVPAR